MDHSRDCCGEVAWTRRIRIVRTIGRFGWPRAGIAKLTEEPRNFGGLRLLNSATAPKLSDLEIGSFPFTIGSTS